MKSNIKINKKVQDTFDSIESIQDVKASPFFKDKTLDRLFVKQEETQKYWSWFTPQLQLVTLTFVIVLNAFAFTKLKETTYNENINQFAETYGLTPTTETSLFN